MIIEAEQLSRNFTVTEAGEGRGHEGLTLVRHPVHGADPADPAGLRLGVLGKALPGVDDDVPQASPDAVVAAAGLDRRGARDLDQTGLEGQPGRVVGHGLTPATAGAT